MTRSVNDLRLGLLRQPSAVLFGPGQRSQLPAVVRRFGTRALVCTDERMASDDLFVALVEALESREIFLPPRGPGAGRTRAPRSLKGAGDPLVGAGVRGHRIVGAVA